MKIIKSCYMTSEDGSYFEAEFDNGAGIVIDTVFGIREFHQIEDNGESILELIEKFGEGELMNFQETSISTQNSAMNM